MIVSYASDHRHIGSEPRRGYRLVGAFAAGNRFEAFAENRFMRLPGASTM